MKENTENQICIPSNKTIMDKCMVFNAFFERFPFLIQIVHFENEPNYCREIWGVLDIEQETPHRHTHSHTSKHIYTPPLPFLCFDLFFFSESFHLTNSTPCLTMSFKILTDQHSRSISNPFYLNDKKYICSKKIQKKTVLETFWIFYDKHPLWVK